MEKSSRWVLPLNGTGGEEKKQNIRPPESMRVLTGMCLCVRSATAAVGVFLGAVRAGARNIRDKRGPVRLVP